jgi:hypothetical protein
VSEGTIYCIAPPPVSSRNYETNVLISFPLRGGLERVVVPKELRGYVVDHGTVFWSGPEGLSKTDAETGATERLSGEALAGALPLDDKDVYFTHPDSQGKPQLRRVARSGGPSILVTDTRMIGRDIAVWYAGHPHR